jgi:anthranilate phosphoribosyltransferase
MRFAGPVRRELGVPTVFNYLGPLANPGRACFQVVGVSDPAMAEIMLGVLAENGCVRAMVVHGADNLDELSTTGPTDVVELVDGELRRSIVDAADYGLARARLEDLKGSDAAANAAVVGRVLSGASGAHRDIVVLNAAAGLMVAGLADDFGSGIELAGAVIDDGRAARVLDALVRVSQECAESS